MNKNTLSEKNVDITSSFIMLIHIHIDVKMSINKYQPTLQFELQLYQQFSWPLTPELLTQRENELYQPYKPEVNNYEFFFFYMKKATYQ